jgi:hypothetical protein
MVRGRLQQLGFAAAAFALAALGTPVQAQFGGILRSLPGTAASAATSSDSSGCPTGRKRSAGSRIAGSVLGQVASSAASSAGISSWVPIPDVADQLTSAIACRLDPEEQKQAAQATLEATRSLETTGEPAEVGSMSSWASNTRQNVSGTSTVVARNDEGRGGLQCITVSDVIIVSGEETRADKRMCRRPPAARYAIAAA